MAQVIISGIDEQVKQNFEQFCSSAGVNAARAFSALVEVGISFNRQGFQLRTEDEAQQRTKQTSSQMAAANFLDAVEKINKEDLKPDDLESFAKFDRGEYKLSFSERLL